MTINPVLSRSVTALVLVLGFLPLVLAHGGGHDEGSMDSMSSGHDNQSHEADKPRDESEYPLSYFSHPDHVSAIYTHIALMTLGWVFILPVGKLESLHSPASTSLTFPS